MECFGPENHFSTTQQYHLATLGEFHVCGITRGTFQYMECRGDNQWGQLAVPPPSPRFPAGVEYKDVCSSWTHSCGVDKLGYGHCWGYLPAQFVMPNGDTKFLSISCGRGYACGILE